MTQPQTTPTFADIQRTADNARSGCIVELNRVIVAIGIVEQSKCYCAGASRCNQIGNRMVTEASRMGSLLRGWTIAEAFFLTEWEVFE